MVLLQKRIKLFIFLLIRVLIDLLRGWADRGFRLRWVISELLISTFGIPDPVDQYTGFARD